MTTKCRSYGCKTCLNHYLWSGCSSGGKVGVKSTNRKAGGPITGCSSLCAKYPRATEPSPMHSLAYELNSVLARRVLWWIWYKKKSRECLSRGLKCHIRTIPCWHLLWGVCLGFSKFSTVNYGQISPLWSHLCKEICSRSLVVCPVGTFQT